MVGRVLARAKALDLTPRAVSLKAGLNATFVRDLLRRPGASPSMENARKLAEALETTVEWLAGGESDEAERFELSAPALATSSLVQASYGGVVEAGAFRPVADDNIPPGDEPLFYPRDPQFPQAALFVFDVAGDSMNAFDPPIRPGTRLLCVSIEQVRIALRTGMVVIVEQVINGGQLRERSVKQIEEHENRFEFCPRSKNPRHKPIVVPKDFKADEGRTVAVIAIVRSVVSNIALS